MANPTVVRIFFPPNRTTRRTRPFFSALARVAMAFILTMSLSSYSLAAPVDVNTADAQSLSDALTGIGPVIAQAIVAYRKENGPFEHVEDLLKVKGIGPKTIERNKADIILGGQGSTVTPE